MGPAASMFQLFQPALGWIGEDLTDVQSWERARRTGRTPANQAPDKLRASSFRHSALLARARRHPPPSRHADDFTPGDMFADQSSHSPNMADSLSIRLQHGTKESGRQDTKSARQGAQA